MNNSARFSYLLKKHVANSCLPSERDELFDMLSDPAYEELLNELMQESWNNAETAKGDLDISSNELDLSIKQIIREGILLPTDMEEQAVMIFIIS